MDQPQPAPAERFAGLLQYLQRAVAVRVRSGLLTAAVVILICQRVTLLGRRFARLAARIQAGTFTPRRSGTRTPPANPKPRQPNPLPGEFGWLLPLLPWAPLFPDTAITCRSRLQDLLADPEMQTLMAAAPAEMGRILRPLCWMLMLKPPAILARPRRVPATEPATLAPAPAPKPAAPRRRPDPPPPDPPAPTTAGPVAPSPIPAPTHGPPRAA